MLRTRAGSAGQSWTLSSCRLASSTPWSPGAPCPTDLIRDRRTSSTRFRATRLLTPSRFHVLSGRHEHLAPEDAYNDSILLVADCLHMYDATIGLGTRPGLPEHPRLAIDRVPMERGGNVPQRLDLKIRDGHPADVGNRHAQQQRVDVVADHHVPAKIRGLTGIVRIHVKGMVVHRE